MAGSVGVIERSLLDNRRLSHVLYPKERGVCVDPFKSFLRFVLCLVMGA